MGKWNPFSRRSSDVPTATTVGLLEPKKSSGLEVLPGSPVIPREKIAHVQRMGTTAVATLTVTELTHESGVEMLSDLLEDLRESGARHFVLDIQNVQFMDSACLGCLVNALNSMAQSGGGGGRIALASAAHSVQNLFRLTRLDRVFFLCADVMSALETVEQDSSGE